MPTGIGIGIGLEFGGGAWAPGNLRNLAACYNNKAASTLTVDGSNRVTSWACQYGGLAVTQDATASMPIYSPTGSPSNGPMVTFDGIDDYLKALSGLPAAMSGVDAPMLVGLTAVRRAGSGALLCPWSLGGTSSVIRVSPQNGGDSNPRFIRSVDDASNDNLLFTSPTTIDAWYRLIWIYSAGTCRVIRDGTELTPQTATNSQGKQMTLSRLAIGAQMYSTTPTLNNYIFGSVARMVVAATVPTAADLLGLDAWLAGA